MAMLSLLKLLQNWRKKCGSEFDALLWHQLMPQGKTAIWVHNYSPFGTQQPQTYFGKFTSCMTFYVDKLVCSEPFLDSRCKIWQLLPALYSDLWKKIYKCTSTFLALNYCIGIFLQSLSYLYEVVRTHFSANFWTFRNFDRNFLEFVAPSSDENENHILPLKARFLLKKRWKPHQNRAINHHTILVRIMHSLRDSEHDKKTRTKHHIFPTGAHSTIFPKLCMVDWW